MSKIRPLRNNIFVLPDKVVDKTETGLILSDYSKKRPSSGTIIAIGEEVEKGTLEALKKLKLGTRIVYGDFSGQRLTINYNNQDTEVFLMTNNDILAILEE